MKQTKKALVLGLMVLFCQCCFAGSVDTVSVYSKAMNKTMKCVVVKPDSYKKQAAFPTVYLLHGYSGSYSDWIRKAPQIKEYADEYQTIIVCPDGAYSSWYFDSPVDSTMRFETYIAKEVPAYIDAHYKTIKDRKFRAITGLSMGGHGGLFLGFRHADFFGACGSMSGALDIEALVNSFEVRQRLGDTVTNRHYYRELSVLQEMENYPKDSIAIIFDCGTDDFLISMNRKAHEKMLKLKIPHDYIERPGRHEWRYWANAVQYQLLFFKNYFNQRSRKY